MIVHVAVTGMQVHAIQNGSNVFPGWSLILIMYTVDVISLMRNITITYILTAEEWEMLDQLTVIKWLYDLM